MAQDNNVTISGNAGREPELRFTPTGQAVANFGVAVSRRWQNRQTQEWEEATSWIDVTAWGALAENVSSSISRGARVTVTGRLDQRSWETDDGDKRSKIEIVADDVAVSLKWATATVTRNESNNQQGGQGGQQQMAPQQAAPQQGGPQPQQQAAPQQGAQPAYNPQDEPF